MNESIMTKFEALIFQLRREQNHTVRTELLIQYALKNLLDNRDQIENLNGDECFNKVLPDLKVIFPVRVFFGVCNYLVKYAELVNIRMQELSAYQYRVSDSMVYAALNNFILTYPKRPTSNMSHPVAMTGTNGQESTNPVDIYRHYLNNEKNMFGKCDYGKSRWEFIEYLYSEVKGKHPHGS